jgi:hypothetical protein
LGDLSGTLPGGWPALSQLFLSLRILEGGPSFAEKLAFVFSASLQRVGDDHSPMFNGPFFSVARLSD